MAKAANEKVPQQMQTKFEEITQLTDAFCSQYLNAEYAQMSRQLTAALCRKRPSPLATGQAKSWACGIVHALGMVNFLYDSSQTPHIKSSQIYQAFGVGESTGQGKSKAIRDTMKMSYYDTTWCLPSRIDSHPTAWLISVNGFLLDVRQAPQVIQEEAFRKGLIPHLPSISDRLENQHSSVLPSLIINRSFMSNFVLAEAPCFALSLVEEENRQCGFLGLRLNETIPAEITEGGFSFGHSLLGNDTYEVIHFAFEFYGYQTYNVLLNPNNPIVREVLKSMIFGGDYFFFAFDTNSERATAFRADIEQDILIYLKANLSRLMNSTTTERQYQQVVSHFSKDPYPKGVLLNWVCRDNIDYLDLSTDRLELTPR